MTPASQTPTCKPPPRPLVLVPPKELDPWPLIPSVLRECECDIGNLGWTLRCSYVALLLSRLCAGMPSDSPFCDVLARVRDCDALSELLACAELDEEGREHGAIDMRLILLRDWYMEDPLEEPLMLSWGDGIDEDTKSQCRYMAEKVAKLKYKHALGPLLDKVQQADGVELGRLAAVAAAEEDFVSYQLITTVMANTSPTTTDFNLWGTIEAVGHMSFEGDDDYNTMDMWLGPIYELVTSSREDRVRVSAWGGHTRKTFERLLWHQIHRVHIQSGHVFEVWSLLSLYLEWAVPALVQLWNDQEYGLLHHKALLRGLCEDEDGEDHWHPHSIWRESMRRLFRTTILVLCQGLEPLEGWWKRVGWIMQAVAQCCPHDNPGLAIATFANHDRWVAAPSLTWDVLKPKLRAWCLGMVLWRIQLQRERQRCLVDWLESSGVYAPTDGRAPKRLCAEFEEFNTFPGEPSGSPPRSAPPSPPAEEVEAVQRLGDGATECVCV